MNVLFTICGRAGSKGIKSKNIREFCGKPLPYYSLSTIDLFLKRTTLDINADIVVSTDSEELIDLMKKNKLCTVEIINRSEDLSGDAIGKVAVIKDCFIKMQDKLEKSYDVIIDLDITSPLRTIVDLDNLFTRFLEKKADVTTSVVPARRNPYFNQLMRTEQGFKKVIESNYTARQQAPEIFDMNASIYAYNPTFLISGKNVLDGYVECIEMYDTGILDLDHENDFEIMEVVARYLYENRPEFSEIRENI